MKALPYHFARQMGVHLLVKDGQCEISLRADVSPLALGEVVRSLGVAVKPRFVSEKEFDDLLTETYQDNSEEAAQAVEASEDLASLADSVADVDDLLDQSNDAPVIRLINAILFEAIKEKASDIHIEPLEKRLSVRFRVDGVLRDVLEPKRALATMLVSRIKVMARLDIAERRVPQDGRVSLRVGGMEIDVRVSTIPSQYGERVVLRLLDRSSTRLGLSALGMSDADLRRLVTLLARPDGLLLVTGPTGSGKTTTLYAALDYLNDKTRNIMTVEDPVEYTLDGIGQTQVNPKADLTFAKGLRAILRQDPDVIMVGEIRDRETAQIAVESSMTGHFVLSTLHTNTAASSIVRLVDMGVEHFLLAPMLRGVVAQRLVRRLCPSCRKESHATEQDQRLVAGLSLGSKVYRPVGCDDCRRQGFKGRTAIYEIIVVDERIAELIQTGASEAEIVKQARASSPSLVDDGLRLIEQGVTSVEEVARVVRDT